jgi:hypothetical protein
MAVDLLELAKRCETASAPDRRLDCEIEAAIGKLKGEFRVVEPPFYDPERYFSGQEGVDWIGYDLLNVGPHHTASLDAALTLVPKGQIAELATGLARARVTESARRPPSPFALPL